MLRFALLSLVALIALACSPGDGGPDAGADAGTTSSAGADTYSAGMMKMGDTVHVILLEASPAPPDVGNNTWTVRVTDMNDQALDDATVVVSPFMPEHQHGTSPPDYAATAAPGEGEIEVGPFDLFMPGLWEMTVSVTTPDGVDDEVVFRFNVEG